MMDTIGLVLRMFIKDFIGWLVTVFCLVCCLSHLVGHVYLLRLGSFYMVLLVTFCLLSQLFELTG
jgi:hypothetical protein